MAANSLDGTYELKHNYIMTIDDLCVFVEILVTSYIRNALNLSMLRQTLHECLFSRDPRK